MYLTEELLFTLLQPLRMNIVRQFSFPNTRYRFDFLLDDSQLIEFDGFTHYADSAVQLRDIKKTELALKAKLKLIRIPYFVQLDENTNVHFFGKDLGLRNNYQHGFHDKKAKTPADFNSYGLQKYYNEIKNLPTQICTEIIQSLQNHKHYQEYMKL